MKKGVFAEIPAELYARVSKAAKKNDMKLKAIVCQALLLWLRQYEGQTRTRA